MSTMNIKIITTPQEHRDAIARLEELWDHEPNSDAADAFELLALLIDHYEQQHEPIAPPHPIEAILFRLDQMGLTRKDLQEVLGVRRGRVSEILNKKRPLSIGMIRRLNKHLGIPASTLIRPHPLASSSSDQQMPA